MPIDSATRSCGHSIFRHLFYNIRCPQQPLAHKVTFVATSILIMGGVIWKGLSSYHPSSRRANKALSSTYLQLETGKYTPIEREAIEFAKEELRNSATQNEDLKNQLNQQTPPWASLIKEHLFEGDNGFEAQLDRCAQKLATQKPKHPDKIRTQAETFIKNFWCDENVILLVDRYMKIGFAISVLTLESLLENSKASTPEDRAGALNHQGKSYGRTAFLCGYVYHPARAARVYFLNKQGQITQSLPKNSRPMTYDNLFYMEGTAQAAWRTLYNRYCTRFQREVEQAQLEKRLQIYLTCDDDPQQYEGLYAFKGDVMAEEAEKQRKRKRGFCNLV